MNGETVESLCSVSTLILCWVTDRWAIIMVTFYFYSLHQQSAESNQSFVLLLKELHRIPYKIYYIFLFTHTRVHDTTQPSQKFRHNYKNCEFASSRSLLTVTTPSCSLNHRFPLVYLYRTLGCTCRSTVRRFPHQIRCSRLR
jgi:hypothetical protein